MVLCKQKLDFKYFAVLLIELLKQLGEDIVT